MFTEPLPPPPPEDPGAAGKLGTALDVMGVGMMTAPIAGITQTLPKVAPLARQAQAATLKGLRKAGVLGRATRGGRTLQSTLYEAGPTKGIALQTAERAPASAAAVTGRTTIPELTTRGGVRLTKRGRALMQAHETGHIAAKRLIRKAGKGDAEAGAFADALMEAGAAGHYRPQMSLAAEVAGTEAPVHQLAKLGEARPHDPTEKVADMLMLLAHAPHELNSVQRMILAPFVTP